MPGCSATNCNGHSRKGLRHFRFPACPIRRAKWTQFCRRPDWMPNENNTLCEKHFDDSQYEHIIPVGDTRRKLKRTAVPTLFHFSQSPKSLPPTSRKRRRCKAVTQSVLQADHCYLNKKTTLLKQALQATQEGCDIATDDITTDRDLFWTAVKVDVTPPSTSPFTSVLVKGEPDDSGEMSTADVAMSREVDATLLPIEKVFADPSAMKMEPEIEMNSWGYFQHDALGQGDPLLLLDKHIRQEVPAGNEQSRIKARSCESDVLTFLDPVLPPGIQEDGGGCVLCSAAAVKEDSGEPSRILPALCGTVKEGVNKTSLLRQYLQTGIRPVEFDDQTCSKQLVSTCSHLVGSIGTSKDKETFKCALCDYSSAVLQHYNTHLCTHTDPKVYKCTMCDYSSEIYTNLLLHLDSHANLKIYKCNSFDYATVYSANFSRHLRVPSHVKRYTCDLCDYSCRDLTNFRQHMRAHEEEKRYMCAACGYSCVDRGEFKSHMGSHLRIGAYKCVLCDFHGETMVELNVHFRVHKLVTCYPKCSWCKDFCVHRGDLDTHTLRDHEGRRDGQELAG